MTRSASIVMVSSLALLMMVGCDKEEPTVKPAPAAQAPVAGAIPAQDAVKDAQAQGQADAKSAVAQEQSAAGDLTAMATQKLDEAVKYIKDNKVDSADKIVSELESRKASLPATIQQRLADVRKMVDTAKAAAANGLALPKL